MIFWADCFDFGKFSNRDLPFAPYAKKMEKGAVYPEIMVKILSRSASNMLSRSK